MDIRGFIITSIMLGVGLAMDAFSVSMVNGMKDPDIHGKSVVRIAGTFAFFQFMMPVIGWYLVHTALNYFTVFEKYVPWIAWILLLYIGGKMLITGIRDLIGAVASDVYTGSDTAHDTRHDAIGHGTLFFQGIATSIDALSVGFTISEYELIQALTSALIIAVVTYLICVLGVHIGKRVGMRLGPYASILGGVILIIIGFGVLF